MRIVKLIAENVKRLVAVEITPTGDVVKITGKNGQGKSSVLDAIWWALAGEKTVQDKPIRDGEKKARVRLELDDYIVTRTFTETGSYLSVENKDGSLFKSPQKMLDNLIGSLSFDPMQFMRMSEKAQLEELRRIVPISAEIDKLDTQRSMAFAERTDVNREIKRLQAQVSAIELPEDCPTEEKSLGDLMKRLDEAESENRRIQKELDDADRQSDEYGKLVDDIYALDENIKQAKIDGERRLAELKAEIDGDIENMNLSLASGKQKANEIHGIIASKRAKLQTMKSVDTAPIRAEIDSLESHNALARKHAERAKLQSRLDEETKSAGELTAKIEAVDSEKSALLKTAQFPVPGLSFGEGTVLYNGLPLAQASSAEQLRVSLGIAMSANNKLRVIRITDGSLLDSASMKIIEEMANDADYQVWIEVVDESGKVGIVIEDGSVLSVNEA